MKPAEKNRYEGSVDGVELFFLWTVGNSEDRGGKFHD